MHGWLTSIGAKNDAGYIMKNPRLAEREHCIWALQALGQRKHLFRVASATVEEDDREARGLNGLSTHGNRHASVWGGLTESVFMASCDALPLMCARH